MQTHTPTTRRGFLGAGSAALALGVLAVVPAMAEAETTKRATFDAELAAIINRPAQLSSRELSAERRERYLSAIRDLERVQFSPRHGGGDEDCDSGHAQWRICAVCDAVENSVDAFSWIRGNKAAATMIRDLRAALSARGLV